MPANDWARARPDTHGVEGPRPYTMIGEIPADAASTQRRPGTLADSRPAPNWDGIPYEVPYNERATCGGTRTDGARCKAKANPGERFCSSHESQG